MHSDEDDEHENEQNLRARFQAAGIIIPPDLWPGVLAGYDELKLQLRLLHAQRSTFGEAEDHR